MSPILKKKAEKTEVAVAEKKTGSVKRSVIRNPHISEKSFGLHHGGQYVFAIDKDANKTLVKEEVERRYGVKVTGVSVVVNKGKVKNFRGRPTKAHVTKKAYVTLKKGDKIEIA